ncbi:cell wall metabolism sensor histidine kinase WalK [Desulfosporosinus orientis]|uniref:cell wall metabolism sensor histidine kinase WalK n=1 Tax=Desulfosporosinus orientis TaxID=1563 RepID=UPI000317864F|nr:cell wall metabolism sensor histidine kinase WalK [Desulfosporosinus orientis]
MRSEDEIGQLSANINDLSRQIELYIGRLKQDLDKEKQLEKTRNLLPGYLMN